MKKQHLLPSFLFLEVLVYGVCFILFLGLLCTVGITMVLSEAFYSRIGDVSYMQTFATMNGILFWSASALIFLFGASCSTLFRCVSLYTDSKQGVSKKVFLTKFLHVFASQWGLIILLIVLVWVGGKWFMIPFMQQQPLYENRADYYPSQKSVEFLPHAVLKES